MPSLQECEWRWRGRDKIMHKGHLLCKKTNEATSERRSVGRFDVWGPERRSPPPPPPLLKFVMHEFGAGGREGGQTDGRRTGHAIGPTDTLFAGIAIIAVALHVVRRARHHEKERRQ